MCARWVVALGIAVAACKGEPAPGAKLVARIPHVDKLDVVARDATDDLPPPMIVVVGASGTLSVDAGPARWSSLGTYVPPRALRAVTREDLEYLVLVSAGFGKRARDELASFDKLLKDRAVHGDPPPPEEEDEPPPEEEQGAMPAPPPPAKVATPSTARGRYTDFSTGFGFGRSSGGGPPGNPVGLARGQYPKQAKRLVSVVGEPVPAVLATQAVIAADPKAKAGALVDAVAAGEGSILVEAGGAVRVLRVQFLRDRETYREHEGAVIEVRASGAGIEVEGVPSPPSKLSWDLALLGPSTRALASMARFKTSPIDVLVGDDVTVQQLVDLIVALDRAGSPAVALGKLPPPGDAEWTVRGKWVRVFTISAVSEDRARDTVKTAEPALRKCYDDALIAKPEIEGRAVLSLSIDPTGKALKATSSGIDPLVGDCLATTLTKLAYPIEATKDMLDVTVRIGMRPHP